MQEPSEIPILCFWMPASQSIAKKSANVNCQQVSTSRVVICLVRLPGSAAWKWSLSPAQHGRRFGLDKDKVIVDMIWKWHKEIHTIIIIHIIYLRVWAIYYAILIEQPRCNVGGTSTVTSSCWSNAKCTYKTCFVSFVLCVDRTVNPHVTYHEISWSIVLKNSHTVTQCSKLKLA